MRNLVIAALALAACSAGLRAQESEGLKPTLSLKVGIPVTDMFSASNTSAFGGRNQLPGSPYTSAVPRYEFGAGAEFHLPYHLRFEVDGLYKRGGFNSFNAYGNGAYRPTNFNWWEVPGVFKYNIAVGHFRPFVDFGASMRHISTIRQTTYSAATPAGAILDNAAEIHNRNSVGAVAGFGITFKKGPFELTPEARYTRWANQAFAGPGLRTNLDQGDVLLGIGF